MTSFFSEALHAFFRNRCVLVTGHTGLMGSWLTLWLRRMEAKIIGVALPPISPRSTFSALKLESSADKFCDIRNLEPVKQIVREASPEIVFHLAAQPIVGVACQDPVYTLDVNVMGTANILESVRAQPSIKSVVMITSDKCYENVEQVWGYREPDRLGGADPYSASKAAAEIVIAAYARSYFASSDTANIASARAGNVVGGGDWSEFRLIPDCIRSLRESRPIRIRHPQATRPWQFVLEPLAGYMLLAKQLYEQGKEFQCAWNFGPAADNTNTVARGAQAVVECWGEGTIEHAPSAAFAESTLLQLDCTKARRQLGWRTVLNFGETMRLTTEWYKRQHQSHDGCMREFSLAQLEAYERRLDRELTT